MADEPVSFKSQQEFQDAVANIFTPMISARFKSLKKEIGDEFKSSLEGVTKTLGTQLEEFRALATQGGGKKPKTKVNADGEEVEEIDMNSPALRTLKKQLDELHLKNKKLEETNAAKDAQQKNIRMRQDLREQLEANGVMAPHSIKAITAMFVQDNKLDFDSDVDQTVWKDTDGAGVELATAVRTWLATPEGEHFAAPTGAAGSGGRPAKRKGQEAEAPRALTTAEIGMSLVKSLQSTPVGT